MSIEKTQRILTRKNLMICHGTYHNDESLVFQYNETDIMARKICNLDTGIWEPKLFVLCPDCKEFCDINHHKTDRSSSLDVFLERYENFEKKIEEQFESTRSNKLKALEQIRK